jgi:hypothetical protein
MKTLLRSVSLIAALSVAAFAYAQDKKTETKECCKEAAACCKDAKADKSGACCKDAKTDKKDEKKPGTK